ncbi:hypothetical protein AJ78_01578 [Emergomyces pasteurianus Ep9510]|uniref:Uncharacterized protein n=1 Tax=Emergomyces pasteurianus Ep9510 TaxID=1447872 RepID=A0A1J9PQD1_9EURO|nr:hypothetical protein AJ78_01578 [Emergomyces pasteurianus Ep9510]
MDAAAYTEKDAKITHILKATRHDALLDLLDLLQRQQQQPGRIQPPQRNNQQQQQHQHQHQAADDHSTNNTPFYSDNWRWLIFSIAHRGEFGGHPSSASRPLVFGAIQVSGWQILCFEVYDCERSLYYRDIQIT